MATRNRTRILSAPDNAIRRINRAASAMRGPGKVKVGLPAGSNNYPDGTSVIAVGATHEFGSPAKGIPERSYLRSTLQEKRRAYREIFRRMGANIATGQSTPERELNRLGLLVESDIKQKITDISTPELQDRDGNPLIDTGHLRQSITYEVF